MGAKNISVLYQLSLNEEQDGYVCKYAFFDEGGFTLLSAFHYAIAWKVVLKCAAT